MAQSKSLLHRMIISGQYKCLSPGLMLSSGTGDLGAETPVVAAIRQRRTKDMQMKRKAMIKRENRVLLDFVIDRNGSAVQIFFGVSVFVKAWLRVAVFILCGEASW